MINYKHLSQIEIYMLGLSSLFKDVILPRYNEDGDITSYIKVPIVHSFNDKWWDISTNKLISSYMNKHNQVNVGFSIPRMSIKFVGGRLDGSRKLNPMNEYKGGFLPIPYIFEYRLNILTKRETDTLKIIEQILPIFPPDITKSVKINENLDNEQVKYKLVDVDPSIPDSQEVDKVTRIESTLTFEARGNLFRVITTPVTDLELEFEVDGKEDDEAILSEILASIK